MKKEELNQAWNKFVKSGKISDYLAYLEKKREWPPNA